MNNTTANNTGSNMTALIEDSEGIIDLLMDNVAIVAILGLILAAIGVYGWFYVPAFKVMVMKLIKKYDAEIIELYEKHLTPKKSLTQRPRNTLKTKY